MDEKNIAFLEKLRERYRFTKHKNVSDIKLLQKAHSERIISLCGTIPLIFIAVSGLLRTRNIDTPTLVIYWVFILAYIAAVTGQILYYRKVSVCRNQLEDALCGDGNFVAVDAKS